MLEELCIFLFLIIVWNILEWKCGIISGEVLFFSFSFFKVVLYGGFENCVYVIYVVNLGFLIVFCFVLLCKIGLNLLLIVVLKKSVFFIVVNGLVCLDLNSGLKKGFKFKLC